MKILINYHFLFPILSITMFFLQDSDQDVNQNEIGLMKKELILKRRDVILNEKKDSLIFLTSKKEQFDYFKKNIEHNDRMNITLKEKNKIESQNSLNEILKNDFNNLKVKDLPKIWEKRYDFLPTKFKNTVYTDLKSYKLSNNESGVEDLIRGFSWSCGNNDKMNKLGEVISVDIGYNNPNLTYKSGMVFFYYKYQILKCKY
jgi:hypothetical protein